ncbi:MAG: molybdopterin-guanine dinucleotide biosynthesis protein B [Desulfobacteraceae bacterium]|nr:molybdopterin-guanine dinucleotide biosynthesis protein B [Desulfobacteraceae bacterium]
MKPEVVSIVSKKNSGKTTLLEKLIPELKERGYRIGTIKHDTHGFSIDHEGKDTWRHKAAGAETVVISCPWLLSFIKDVKEEPSLDELAEMYFGDMDLVLTEGYKRGGKPQLEVYRRAIHDEPLHTKENPDTLVAMVSDVTVDLGVPCFDINDISGLADFLVERFIIRKA